MGSSSPAGHGGVVSWRPLFELRCAVIVVVVVVVVVETTGSSSPVAFRLRQVDERFADDMKGALPDGRRKLVLISVEACETTIKAAQRRAS
jgi:hypothetical protein